METDLSLWRSWRKHQLADGVEDDLKLGVVFVFECGKLAGKLYRVRGNTTRYMIFDVDQLGAKS